MLNYIVHVLISFFIMSLLGFSACVFSGLTKRLFLAQAAVYGFAAYVVVLAENVYGLPMVFSVLLSIIAGLALSVLLVSAGKHLSSDLFIVATLTMQLMIGSLFYNLRGVTNGAFGIAVASEAVDPLVVLLLACFAAVVAVALVSAVKRSEIGRVLHAGAADEHFTLALGKPLVVARLISASLGGVICAVAAQLYVVHIGFVHPSAFDLSQSIAVLSILVIGGMQNVLGIFGASALFVIVPEILRFVGLPAGNVGHYREIIFGVMLVSILRIRIKRRSDMAVPNAQ